MKKKITIIIFVILFISVMIMITNKLTDNKISNTISVGYLYLTSPKEITFEGIIINRPYNFIENKDQNSLILIKFPNSKTIIFFTKIELLTPVIFFNSYNYRLKKLNFNLINKATREVHGNLFYTLSGTKKSDPSEYIEYAYIPSHQVIVEYSGLETEATEFWEILQSIKFANTVKTS